MKGNPAANIFLAKNLLGYTDLLRAEHSGPLGGPIEHVAVADILRARRQKRGQGAAIKDGSNS